MDQDVKNQQNKTPIQRINGIKASAFRLDGCALTIGNFDGIHLGHRALLGEAMNMAHKFHLPSVVMTFDPHPSHVLNPAQQTQKLSNLDEQTQMLGKMGLDYFIVEPFNRDFSNLTAEAFLDQWLLAHLAPKALIVGYDFSFGKNRQGTLATLQTWTTQHRLELVIVEPVHVDHQVVSSSLIRKALHAGNIQLATQLLGRRYSLAGEVIKGDGRGRQIGVPTANLHGEEGRLVPGRGVYSGWCLVRGQKLKCVMNIGVRPTFVEAGLRDIVEVHLLDWHGSLYGEKIEIEFVEHVREEKKFNSVDELVQQIRHDVEWARRSL